MALRDDQLERYQRHIMLKEIGGAGQQKLLAARVLIIGAGGLGAPLLSYLAAAGIGTIGIIDPDIVSLSNLQRQVLYTMENIGELKVEVAEAKLKALNPDCKIETHPYRLTADNALDLIKQYDLVADGCDNFETRFLVNDACYYARKPLVSAALGRFDGQVSIFKPFEKDAEGKPLPCYRSLVSAAPAMDEQINCAQMGVLGALAGIVGSLQALEIIKEIIGMGEPLVAKLLIYNALTQTSRIVNLVWDPQNPLNGTNPRFTDLSHHK